MNVKLLLCTFFVLPAIGSLAQNSSKTYAITGTAANRFVWTDIKQIDISNGKTGKTLYESGKTAYKAVSLDRTMTARAEANSNPAGFGIAACAYDARHNRLYFAPMHFSEISYVALNKSELTFTTVKRNILPAVNKYVAEENQLSRMVIGADGFGYALTNDGNHLLRFSTGKSPVVEDLGALSDAESNKGISVHNKCSSWGGDMLADAFGKLVVISANHNVYTIDVKTKIATYTGTISGLPANYTTNGAVVDDNGDIIVSSANVFDGLFKVNYKDLKAVKVETEDKTFNASDMANANLLLQKEADALVKFDVSKSMLPSFAAAGDARVYPNPIVNNQVNVLFDGQPSGRYSIQVTDIAGRILQVKDVTITGKQLESVRFSKKPTNGTYIVKVVNSKKELAFTDKVVVQ